MDHPLDGCREKVNWAERELNALEVEIGQWARDNPYSTAHHFYDEANLHVFWAEVPEYPVVTWGVRIGNVVHNLRSALDHLVWQLVLVNGQQPKSGSGGNQFPVFSCRPKQGFGKRVNGSMLRGVADEDRAAIKHFQPYKRPNELPVEDNPLAALADLSNEDKHQVVFTTLWSYEPGTRMTVQLLGNETSGTVEDYETFAQGRLYDGAVVGWAIATPTGPDPEMDMEAYFTANVVFSNGRAVTRTLNSLMITVRNIIEAFAPRMRR